MPQGKWLRNGEICLVITGNKFTKIGSTGWATLLLLAITTSIRTVSLTKKKTIPRGFNWSAVRPEIKYVREQDEWTLVQIEKRGRILSNRALKNLAVPPSGWSVCRNVSRFGNWGFVSLKKNTDDLDLSDDLKSLINALGQWNSCDRQRNHRSNWEKIRYVITIPNFFLEVLPASWRLRLLLNISIADLNDPPGDSTR